MAGRPKKKIDYELVEKLAYIQCTQEEISSILGISTRTLQRDKEFCRIYKNGMDNGKMSLRRLQWKAAEKGNNTMLVWLGKQYLGQTDKQELAHSGSMDIVVDVVRDGS
jgi:hypothetical protein